MKEIQAQTNSNSICGITRRHFVGGMAAGFALTLLPSMSFGGTPKTGGKLRIALVATSANDTFDPSKMATNADAIRAFQMYNCLIRSSTKLTPEPSLAESWEASSDATKWTFNIRRGVTFHNGKDLTSADVIYSLDLHRGEDSKSPAKATLENVKEIEADGQYSVKITLKTANADLPMILTDYHLVIVPEGYTDFDNPIGTGPFTLKEFKPGVKATLSRNSNYWETGKPYIDEVETFAIKDTGIRLNALLSGEADIIEEVDPKTAKIVEAHPDITLAPAKNGRQVSFIMMCDKTPFTSPDVRMAFKYLQDREKFKTGVLKGYGQIANDHPVSPIDPNYANELPIRQYDPDMAKHYLKKAGMEKTQLTLHTSTGVHSSAVDMAIYLREMAKPAGIDIEVKREPSDGYWSNIWMKKPLSQSYWNTRPSADFILTAAYYSKAPWNETQWKSEKFDKLLVEARGTLDKGLRKEMYFDLQKMIHNDGGLALPCFLDYLDAHSNSVKGYKTHPQGTVGGWPFAHEVWLG